MFNRVIQYLIIICLFTTFAQPVFAQQSPASPSSSEKRSFSGPRKQLATIVFAGLGGAILGLSTLSFYGRPQDKLSNIALGAAVGVISGTAFVTYRAATNPAQFYGQNTPQSESEMHTNRLQASNSGVQVTPLRWQFGF